MDNPADFSTVLSGVNSEFLEDLYRNYLEAPASLDPQWRAFFDAVANGHSALGRRSSPSGGYRGDGGSAGPQVGPGAGPKVGPARQADASMFTVPEQHAAGPGLSGDGAKQSGVFQLINNYRVFGHTRANLDPLGRPHLERPPDLSLQFFGLSEADLDETYSTGTLVAPSTRTLREIVDQVTQTYCGPVGMEYMMIRDQSQRLWLQQAMEQTWNRPRFDKETRRDILTMLTRAELFEKFLHTKFVGQKRFSLEGAETLITLLDGLVEEAAELGVEEIVMGMSHRGRLNVLVNVMEKAPQFVFSEFEDATDINPLDGTGDVKYHLGYSSDRKTRSGREIHLSLSFNPSHLEAVNPVVEGNVRAKQDRRGDRERTQVMPVLMHGDAAFAGQGLVPETLNLSQLEGYTTGGTIHIIVNNQIGFTTHPRFARSFAYPSDMAKILLVPVFHVNGDDPEAVHHVVKLAVNFRQTFHTDVVIDMFCYRRHGHNEMDEPSFTQPLTYKLVRQHPSTLEIYSAKLREEGVLSAEEIGTIQQNHRAVLDRALEETRANGIRSVTDTLHGAWTGLERHDPRQIVVTEVNREVLQEISDDLTSCPEGFTPHPRIAKLLETRRQMMAGEVRIDWGFGELLAYGSLLREGYHVRLSGQDCTRGTFSHRHANLVDIETGEDYTALQHLTTPRGVFSIHDSPLSEAGVLGFDFGYSLADPLSLILWEAQFGDFANGAQVIVDQFIASSEVKWLRMSGLVMLLPHGFEGQGPEHSSARIERFLQLCAEDNIQVCYATTPAQNFHMLRRQIRRSFRKPLISMAPKSLLRHPLATSTIADLINGTFREVLYERDAIPPEGVRRIVFCSGKVYYDLLAERRKRELEHVALVRLEQLYPFPVDQAKEVLGQYPNVKEACWVQEDPQNMGAWTFVQPRMEALLPKKLKLRYVGRPAAASPAVGSHRAHAEEQKAIVAEALA
ncbi:MAG: 2-oxoglutarate dehydrogenase E1 component [SAR324 cluster bacterium]|nr:2-oxoglutarate dehydrogenase E1 component [SAR324 cluster bacterium]